MTDKELIELAFEQANYLTELFFKNRITVIEVIEQQKELDEFLLDYQSEL